MKCSNAVVLAYIDRSLIHVSLPALHASIPRRAKRWQNKSAKPSGKADNRLYVFLRITYE